MDAMECPVVELTESPVSFTFAGPYSLASLFAAMEPEYRSEWHYRNRFDTFATLMTI